LVPKNADTLFSVQKIKLALISGICYWVMFNWYSEIKTEWYNSYRKCEKKFLHSKKDNGESTTNEKEIMPLLLIELFRKH
jgi:hypothetical protein